VAQQIETRTDVVTVSPAQHPAGRRRDLGHLRRIALPALVIATFLALWEWLPLVAGVPQYVLPNFDATLAGLRDNWPDIGLGLMITLQDALIGFLIGNCLAILGATIFTYSVNTERAFYPIAILVQTVPIIVYVPLLRLLFFQTPGLSANPDASAVIAVTVLVSFFPTLVNMTAGFKAVDPNSLDLMRTLNASKTQVFLKVRCPSGLPFLFSSLKITSTLAFVGAIVGEWMSNSGFNGLGQVLSSAGVGAILGFPTNPANAAGIGYELSLFQFRVNKPGIFAAVLAVSILTMLFFGLMVLLERWAVPWRRLA
jgi:NitT/TauT family transport system permease protein